MRLETQIGNRKKRENGQTDGRRDSLAVAPSEQGQVRQLFNADHRVVDGRLKTLRDHVGKNHRDQDGQNVADLTRQLHHDHSGRHGVSDSCRQRCRSCSNREREIMMLILLTTAQKHCLILANGNHVRHVSHPRQRTLRALWDICVHPC